ncbi:50S ribosomal protein L29 [Helicobacter sp. 13S00401-1]|uniref:50S ribosomal protein L29 n=1 Tax=unclassified Helicobacter TaxID=2593540 RepID=UPI000BA7D2F7|nr:MULTISPECIES: 50S ribosomal protein L29 [unclassified Helicobacter]PAF44662.1 50S ribosomal protein L29 [Helicobacter sp. 11S02629-2]PAF51161.1 50S ribosomal protein L29 [Helicobacter sp. 13S00401-1]
MKFIDLKNKSLNELNELLKEKKGELFTLRIKLKTMQLTKSHEISIVKKDIAKIYTALNLLKETVSDTEKKDS